MLCLQRWSDAGPAGSGVVKVIAESPKQGRKRLNFITKTISFAYLGILFIYDVYTDQNKVYTKNVS